MSIDPRRETGPLRRQHDQVPGRRRRREGQLRSSRHADGSGRRGLRPVESFPALRPQTSPTGPTAIDSCSPPVTAACCSTRLLHLAGYDLSLSELRDFRQWESKTPGHPEFGHTVGVEATTGPLGQGIGNAVGMALSAQDAGRAFQRHGGFEPVSHRIFVLASDGDLMEGVSGEASSLAGHLGLGNLIVLYDDNRITIEGRPSWPFRRTWPSATRATAGSAQRVDGHDHEAIAAAIEAAISEADKPSVILCRTHIAHGAPTKQDTADSHGSPLGADEIEATKIALGWPTGADLPHSGGGQDVLQGTGRRGSGLAHGVGRESRRMERASSRPGGAVGRAVGQAGARGHRRPTDGRRAGAKRPRRGPTAGSCCSRPPDWFRRSSEDRPIWRPRPRP